MKVLKPDRLPKVKRQLRVSSELRTAMAQMSSLIKRGDKSTLEVSDDGMQDDDHVVSGGLFDKEKKIYDFTYYTSSDSGDNPHQVWILRLTEGDVQKLGNGTLSEMTLWTCSDPACLHAEHNSNFTCFRCDYYDDGKPSFYAQYIKE